MSMTNNRPGGSGGSPFPAQVRFKMVHEFAPLPEVKFHHVLKYKSGQGFGIKGGNAFEIVLSSDQVQQLMGVFIEQQRGRR